MRSRVVKIGTRGSRLALAQTEFVIRRLQQFHPALNFQAVPIRTSGDRITSAAALRRGGKGLFVKEIEQALLARRVALAVHSLKDLPSELPEGLELGAILERADPSDVFVSRSGKPLDKLPPGATIGTSSLRRQAILRSLYPHLKVVEMKGNVDTRLEKLGHPRSAMAGIVLAAAGLQRLFPADGVPSWPLPRDVVVPAPGQGALAIEVRADDKTTKRLVAPLHHPLTAACVAAERELLRRLEGGCQVPLGAYAEPLTEEEGLFRLTACIASPDGSRLVRESQTGTLEDPLSVAEALETILSSRGAREILAALHRPARAAARRRPARRRPRVRARSLRPRRRR